MWLIAIIAGIVVVVLLINALQGSRARAEAKERIERANKEALKFFGDLERRKKLTIIPVDIVLKKGEVGILQESSSLHETRSFRVYGGVVHALRGYMLAAAPPSRTSD
ncbi:MAG: hypothetical protein HYV04_03950 [Deltaproteobacteria bacterium]|nr:hypothetical protein [Deltaproteobacteria bacterium]